MNEQPPTNPYWFRAKPEASIKYPYGVKDGDSYAIRCDLGMRHDPLYSVRLFGADTPEKYGTRADDSGRKCGACEKRHTDEEEAREEQAAKEARAFVEGYFKRAIPIGFYKEGIAGASAEKAKYDGRIVSAVWVHMETGWVNLTQALLDAGFTYEYFGGTKRCFNEWYAR